MKPASGFSAFISYASDDREKAHEICRNLEARGLTCWIAPRDVRAGREYADEIVTGIEKSACLIVLLSKAANVLPPCNATPSWTRCTMSTTISPFVVA